MYASFSPAPVLWTCIPLWGSFFLFFMCIINYYSFMCQGACTPKLMALFFQLQNVRISPPPPFSLSPVVGYCGAPFAENSELSGSLSWTWNMSEYSSVKCVLFQLPENLFHVCFPGLLNSFLFFSNPSPTKQRLWSLHFLYIYMATHTLTNTHTSILSVTQVWMNLRRTILLLFEWTF